MHKVRQFIDDHILKNSGQIQPARSDSVIPPKFILKMIAKSGAASTQVYYCKNLLINYLIENMGAYDLILQQFVH